jgi:hypothetical protein
MAVRRMVQAGAVPMTWMTVLSEPQRDRARESTLINVKEVKKRDGKPPNNRLQRTARQPQEDGDGWHRNIGIPGLSCGM